MALPGGLSPVALLGVAAVGVGAVVLLVSARHVWRATAVVRAPAWAGPGASENGSLTRVSGTVVERDGDAIEAPFSGVDCVALRYRVEERRFSVLNLLPWYVTVREGSDAVAFDLRTARGTVSVDEPARTVVLTTDLVATTRPGERAPARIERFERRRHDGRRSRTWRDPPSVLEPLFRAFSIGTRRYGEQRAAVGDELTVVGRVSADGSAIDPLVVSDRAPIETGYRMARTSLGGSLVGLAGVALGAVVLVGP